MVIAISWALPVLPGLIAILVAVLLLGVVAAIALPSRKCSSWGDIVRQRVALLAPAHDESTGLLAMLEDVRAPLVAGDRLIVVADNCTDDTAAVAAAGAEVVQRHDLARIGKGYALDWGLQHLHPVYGRLLCRRGE